MKKLIITVTCLMGLTLAEAAVPTVNTVPMREQISVADTANANDYLGKYKLEGLPIDYIELSNREGKPYYVAGQYEGFLTPMAKTDMYDANGQSTFTFTRGADSKVTAVVVNIQGQEITGVREMTKMDINAYVGKYKMEGMPFDYTEVTVKDGKLMYNSGNGQYTGELVPKANKDEFDAGQAGAKFARDASGKVTTLYVTAQGQDFVGTKEAAATGMAAYVGKYKMSGLPFETMEIIAKDGKLMIDAMGQVSELTPTAQADQFDAGGQATIKFTRDASGKINGVTLEAQGQNFGGEKISILLDQKSDKAEALAAYTGTYEVKGLPFKTVKVWAENEKLMASANGEQIEITQMASTDQFDADWLATVEFIRDADNNVTGLTLVGPHERFDGLKIAQNFSDFNLENLLPEEVRLTMIAGSSFFEASKNEWVRMPTPGDEETVTRPAHRVAVKKYDIEEVLIEEINMSFIAGSPFMEVSANEWLRIATPADAQQKVMSAYVGNYQMTGLPFENLQVALLNGNLLIFVNDQKSELTPMSGVDQFTAANGRATLTFVRDADQQVTGITVLARSLEFSGQKES